MAANNNDNLINYHSQIENYCPVCVIRTFVSSRKRSFLIKVYYRFITIKKDNK